jgi:hypothetical protein
VLITTLNIFSAFKNDNKREEARNKIISSQHLNFKDRINFKIITKNQEVINTVSLNEFRYDKVSHVESDFERIFVKLNNSSNDNSSDITVIIFNSIVEIFDNKDEVAAAYLQSTSLFNKLLKILIKQALDKVELKDIKSIIILFSEVLLK